MKKWYKSKTLWFNLFMAALAAIEGTFSYFQDMLQTNIYGIIATILAIGNAILRVISDSKLIK